jgi:hypothetical protein
VDARDCFSLLFCYLTFIFPSKKLEGNSLLASISNPSKPLIKQGNALDKLGVSITTRPLAVVSERDKPFYSYEHSTVHERSWTASEMMARPHLMTTTQWSDTMIPTTVLYNALLPDEIILSSQMASQAYASFQFIRGNLEFHIQTTGTPFHAGTVIAAYIPLQLDSSFNTTHFTSLTALQHVMLQANAATSAVLKVPFIYPNDYYTTSQEGTIRPPLGRLVVVVFNKLRCSTTSAREIEVSVFGRMTEAELKIPSPPFNWTTEASIGLGRIIQRMLPKNIVADSIDFVASFFGLDKPTSTVVDAPNRLLGVSYMNSSVAVEYLDKFSLFPAELQETSPEDFSTFSSDMAMDVLLRRLTYLGSFTQDFSQPSGTRLANWPISPTPANITIDGPTPNRWLNPVPLLQYVATPFHQWRGGLTYKIQVVASTFHVSKIFVSINYDLYKKGPDLATISDITQQYGLAFEVNQGSDEFEFTVPYVSYSHSKWVSADESYSQVDSLGTINVYVINELAYPNNVTTQIEFNVFVAAADDFQFSTIAGQNLSLIPAADAVGSTYGTYPLPVISAPSGFTTESAVGPVIPSNTETTEDALIVSPVEAVIPRTLFKSEPPLHSLAELLKKYSHVFSLATKSGTFESAQDQTSWSIAIAGLLDGSLTQPTIFSYFSSLFAAFRGPLRFKFVLRTAVLPLNFTVIYVPPLATGNPPPPSTYTDYSQYVDALPSGLINVYSGVPGSRVNWLPRHHTHFSLTAGVQQTVEIEIPYTRVNNFSMFSSDRITNNIQNDLGWFVIIPAKGGAVDTAVPTPAQIDIYMAFGDESRFGILARVPNLYSNTYLSPSNRSPFPDSYLGVSSRSSLKYLSTNPV